MSIVIINFLCRILQCVRQLVYYYNTLRMFRRELYTTMEGNYIRLPKPSEGLSRLLNFQ